jgi:hypothetical protein
LVIVALFTALIGPYLVDWTAYRDTFEREASAYIGRPVSIGGKADLRLLPTPLLSFGDVRIGDADAPEMEMERFRAEVELASLLKGEIRVIRMEIARPHFRIDLAGLAAGNGEPSAKRWRLDPERISLTLLEVEGGTAEIVDSRAERSWRAEDISATIEAGSLRGPGKIDATFELDGKPLWSVSGWGVSRPRRRSCNALLDLAADSPDPFRRGRPDCSRGRPAAICRGCHRGGSNGDGGGRRRGGRAAFSLDELSRRRRIRGHATGGRRFRGAVVLWGLGTPACPARIGAR